MKKLILLAAAALFTFVSCSEDDDAGSQDQIVGVWTLHKEFLNFEEEFLTDCERQETYIFNDNGTLDYEDYYQEDEMADCTLDETASGSWSNDGNNAYTLSSDFGSATFDVTFEANTFSYEEVETYSTIDEDGNTITVTEVFKTVFIRQ